MESYLKTVNNAVPPRDIVNSLAAKFSGSAERLGKVVVQPKQVWNWFQNRRYSNRSKLHKAPAKLAVSTTVPEDSTSHRNVTNSVHATAAPGKNPFDNTMEFEAKSVRDGAWYDVGEFLAVRNLENGDPEVQIRLSGLGIEENEWVNVRECVRQRSLPCDAVDCAAVLPGDLILCFQEGTEQALYFNAHVLDTQRRRHDMRGCRCRFLVRYDHDQSEEIVPLKKICRRPETEQRMQVLLRSRLTASDKDLNEAAQKSIRPPKLTDVNKEGASSSNLFQVKEQPVAVAVTQMKEQPIAVTVTQVKEPTVAVDVTQKKEQPVAVAVTQTKEPPVAVAVTQMKEPPVAVEGAAASLHLYLSSNNARSLDEARILAENLLSTISAECGASRMPCSGVYSTVPPPQQLVPGTRNQNSATEVNGNMAPAINPSLVSTGTNYSGYGGIYPQATPLQQVALALRHAPAFHTIPTTHALAKTTPSQVMKLDEKIKLCSSEKDTHQKRKFKERAMAPVGTSTYKKFKSDASLSDLDARKTSLMPPPVKSIQSAATAMPPPPPPPPPRPSLHPQYL